jgi:hypothetical protein
MSQAVAVAGLLVVVLEMELQDQQMVVDMVADKVIIPLVLQQNCLEEQILVLVAGVVVHIPALVVLVVLVVLVLHMFRFQLHSIQEHILPHPQLQSQQAAQIQL